MIAYKIKLLKDYKVWKEGKVLQVDKKLFDELTGNGTAEEFKSVTKEDRLFKFLAQNEGKFPDIDRVNEDEVADVVKKRPTVKPSEPKPYRRDNITTKKQ